MNFGVDWLVGMMEGKVQPGRSAQFYLPKRQSITLNPNTTKQTTLSLPLATSMEPVVTETQVAPPKKQKKLKPARKQVKPGEVEKKEAPQSGKEYSAYALNSA